MSHRKKRPMPPASRVHVNLEGLGPAREIVDYHVGSWCPLPDGRGEATQVWLTFNVAGQMPQIVRFKSAAAVDEMIDALVRHRVDVWPGVVT